MVYVDHARIPYRRMLMNHMIADTLEELHDMADRIGLPRKYFQNKRNPHYDVCCSKRALAIAEGAVPVDSRTLVQVRRRIRDRHSSKA